MRKWAASGILAVGMPEDGQAVAGMVLGRMGIRGSNRLGQAVQAAAAISACLALANCSSSSTSFSRLDPKYGVSSSPRVVGAGEPVPKGGGTYRIGKPYTVAGKLYVPEENINYRAEGIASWYGDAFHGRLTANGEVFDMASLTAAHPTLPIPSYARVTNVNNGKSLIVRVNDRGPYHGNRLIDVSNKAAELLEFKGNGTAKVRVEYVGRAPLEGSDDHWSVSHRRGPSCPTCRAVASSPAMFLCRRAARIRLAIRQPTWRRSVRHLKCQRLAACAPPRRRG
jgi:rare lipoprotein A